MIDITEFNSGTGDIQVFDSQVGRASNIMSIQLGSLEYASSLGIDLKYFLQDSLRFQNESFQSYLIEVLANNGISVASLSTRLESLYAQYIFDLAPEDNSDGLIAR